MTQLPDLMTSPIITISFDTDPERFRITGGTYIHKDRITSIPGSWFTGGGKDYWTIPKSWPALKVMVRLFSDSLNWAPEVVEWANSIWTGLIEPSLELRNAGAKPEWVEAVAKLLPDGIMAKDYQVAGAIYLATAHRALLFDEQGTGKMVQTAMTLSLYPDIKDQPTLIIAPKSVVWTWKDVLSKFGIESVVVDGDAAERRKQFAEFSAGESGNVLITSYALVSKHSRVEGFGTIKLSDEHKTKKELNAIKWHTVVADECHRIKDPDSVQTRACWAVRDGATNVWGLTGTPIEKNIMDMWALLHFIAPLEFPTKTKFLGMWVLTAPAYFGGIDILGIRPDVEDEFRAITEWHWRRVLTAADLPPAIFDLRLSHMNAKGRKAYNDMKKQLMAELDSDGSFDTLFSENHMVKAGRLKQMASATCVIDANDSVRMVEPSWKLDSVEDAMVDYPVPSIFWFDNRDLLHMLAARFDKKEISYVEVHGDVTGKDRHENIRKFQDGEVEHILVTYGAGSEGTTLTRASVAHRVQRPWSSIQDSQAPFRNRRIGSEIHDSIVYVDHVVVGTVEEDQRVMFAEKGEAIQEVLRDQR